MNQLTEAGEVDAKPLTNWKNSPTLLALKQDYTDAKPVHDSQVTKIRTWLDNMGVTGSAKIKTPTGNSAIQPKLIRKQAEWRYPALSEPFLADENLFTVKPRTWEDKAAAQQNELVLNSQFNKDIDRVTFIGDYVRAAVDEGTVIVRVGWEFEEEEVEVQVPVAQFVADPNFAPTIQHILQMQQESPSEYELDVPPELKQAAEMSQRDNVPYRPEIIGNKTVKQMKTIVNRPTLEVCDYRNVVFDPTCKGNLEKAGFAVYSFESSLSILKKDPRYKNLDKLNLEGNSILADPDHAPDGGQTNFNFNDKPRKKFVVYEYWGFWDIDGSGKVVPILVSWVGNTIIRMELNPFPDKGLPFVVVQYLPKRGELYGEPDGELLEDNQKVIGAVTRGMIDIMGKSANGQTGVRKDMLDATNRRKFDKGLDYEFNPTVDPRGGVFMHVYPEIPQSAQVMLQLQNFEAESLTGVKSFSQGVSGAALGDVAAGVRGALDAASKRELDILRRLKNGMVKIGRKIIAMNGVFLSDEEVVRVTNEQFVKVRRDDLAGNFDLVLGISTAEENNNKAEQLAFMYQTSAPNGDAGMNKMILSDIAKLRKMPDLAHRIETYEPQPDPIQQQKIQLEIALLQAQVATEQAKAAHYAAGSNLQVAKSDTEVAKAGNLRSNTDKQNLDFVEQESGVKQERERQLMGEQARSNEHLAMVKHAVDQQENSKDRQHDLLKEYVKGKAAEKAKKAA